MPHIIIEHPKEAVINNDLSVISKNLHYKLSQIESIDIDNIKTRTSEVENINIGKEKTLNEFIHVTILLLPGRSPDLKEHIVRSIYQEIKLSCPEDYTISVELRELETYYKG